MLMLMPLLAMAAPRQEVEDARTCRVARSGPDGSYAAERTIVAGAAEPSLASHGWFVRKRGLRMHSAWYTNGTGGPQDSAAATISLPELPKGTRWTRIEVRRGEQVVASGKWTDFTYAGYRTLRLTVGWGELRAAAGGTLTVVAADRDGRAIDRRPLTAATIAAPTTLAESARSEFEGKMAAWRTRCDPYVEPEIVLT